MYSTDGFTKLPALTLCPQLTTADCHKQVGLVDPGGVSALVSCFVSVLFPGFLQLTGFTRDAAARPALIRSVLARSESAVRRRTLCAVVQVLGQNCRMMLEGVPEARG